MCCDGWELACDEDETEEPCPDCGGLCVVHRSQDGVHYAAKYGCNYSPQSCETCDAHDCDLSC